MEEQRQWFSTKVRLVSLVESSGATSYMDCIHVFLSMDWDSALVQAIELGRTHEREYLNGEGLEVRWCLKEVVSLDLLRVSNLDGVEVHSELLDVGTEEWLPFESIFHPERSEPTQTL